MQPGLLGVDVAALRALGSDVAGAAATLRETVKSTGPGLAPAVQPGSAACTAAQAAQKAWSADLDRLTARLAELGRKMADAADGYQVADETGADDLRRGGSGRL
jgi:uncharacterized protein YukE